MRNADRVDWSKRPFLPPGYLLENDGGACWKVVDAPMGVKRAVVAKGISSRRAARLEAWRIYDEQMRGAA